MSVFPLQSLMDEQACYEYLLSVLHPPGLPCPQGHPLPGGPGGPGPAAHPDRGLSGQDLWRSLHPVYPPEWA